jgi:hypothetical protein
MEFINRQSETDNGEGLVIDRAGTTPPDPPFARGGKRRNETGMNARVGQGQLCSMPR